MIDDKGELDLQAFSSEENLYDANELGLLNLFSNIKSLFYEEKFLCNHSSYNQDAAQIYSENLNEYFKRARDNAKIAYENFLNLPVDCEYWFEHLQSPPEEIQQILSSTTSNEQKKESVLNFMKKSITAKQK